MAPNVVSNGTSGYNTPDSQLESILPVHPTAARRPHAVTVQSENTLYSDEYITSKFVNRGSAVTVTDGQYLIKPTSQTYEFQTKRNVSKTGYVS
jgi:myo-inositol-1-phosphate synthase